MKYLNQEHFMGWGAPTLFFRDALAIAPLPESVAQAYAEKASAVSGFYNWGGKGGSGALGVVGLLAGAVVGGIAAGISYKLAKNRTMHGCSLAYTNAKKEPVLILICGSLEHISDIYTAVPSDKRASALPPPFDQLRPCKADQNAHRVS